MTDRAEIERLLNATGRTLKWLPEDYGDKKLELWNSFRDKTFGHIKSFYMANRILHQSDVIELLVGALRDALEERDAAIKEIPRACGYCKNFSDPPKVKTAGDSSLAFIYCEKECHNISGVNTGWEWRGVKKNDG